jgi:hypothetical protein
MSEQILDAILEYSKPVLVSVTVTLFEDLSVRIEASPGNKVLHLGMLEMARGLILNAAVAEAGPMAQAFPEVPGMKAS